MHRNSIGRSFFVFLLLFAFMISMIGTFTSYFTFLHRISFQQKVKQERTDESRILTFSKDEFCKINWEEKNIEFEFKGKMYDVASIEFKSGLYFITCENDFIEDLLLGFLTSDSKSKGKSPQIQLSEPENLYQPVLIVKSNLKVEIFHSTNFLKILLEKNPPPPRIA